MDKGRIGIILGSGMGGLTNFTANIHTHAQKGLKKVSPLAIPYTITNMGGALL